MDAQNVSDTNSKNNFATIVKLLRKNYFEITLVALSVIVTTVVLVLHMQNLHTSNSNEQIEIRQGPSQKTTSHLQQKYIFVDVSGAVMNPNIYKATLRSRLKDVLIMAGGLSANANRDFFYRNFNLASYVYGQEKIYIPHNYEIWQGIFTEPHRIIDFTKPVKLTDKIIDNYQTNTDNLVNINTATSNELDALPGIGPTTAQKIISNRPYVSVQELLDKKAVSKNVFSKIKDKVKVD